MSLHWSSSSSSGHTLSEKRTASSTCWRKTSSMRKSTPKTKETGVCRGERTLGTGSDEKRRRDGRLSGWFGAWGCELSRRTICLLWSDQTGKVTALLMISARVASAASAGRVPSQQPLGLHFLSLPFQRSSAQRVSAGLCLETDCPQLLVRPRLLIGYALTRTKHFWLCTVWLCLIVF